MRTPVGDPAPTPVVGGYVRFMSNEFEKLKQAVAGGARVINVSGLTSIAAKACCLVRLQAETAARFAIVADTNSELESWACDLEFFAGLSEGAKPQIISLPSF